MHEVRKYLLQLLRQAKPNFELSSNLNLLFCKLNFHFPKTKGDHFYSDFTE